MVAKVVDRSTLRVEDLGLSPVALNAFLSKYPLKWLGLEVLE